MRVPPITLKKKAFTLVELSIVLVIIGLLIGAILVGQNLIRASELRSVITEVDRLQTAILVFKNKYNGLPGDIPDAESIWGSDSACPNTTTNNIKKEATCNGTGDGRISNSNSAGSTSLRYERYRTWQQLANAGLIPGQYTGVTGPGGLADSTVGLNAPASKISMAGFDILFYQQVSTGNLYPVPAGHMIWFGKKQTACATSGFMCSVFSPEEQLSLDKKMDDGLPGLGVVQNRPKTSIYTPDCTTSDTASTATYDISRTDILCAPVFILRGF